MKLAPVRLLSYPESRIYIATAPATEQNGTELITNYINGYREIGRAVCIQFEYLVGTYKLLLIEVSGSE